MALRQKGGPLNSFRVVVLLALGTVAAVAPASAWPYIDVTASETLSLDPPRHRTTFALSFVGYGNPYQMFSVSPIGLEPIAYLYDCTAGTPWSCVTSATTFGDVFFYTDTDPASSTPASFAIVTDRIEPCVRFAFLSPLLANGATPSVNDDYNYYVDACLRLDAPVPARLSSWGSVKSRYR
jgi:hypothetical protein